MTWYVVTDGQWYVSYGGELTSEPELACKYSEPEIAAEVMYRLGLEDTFMVLPEKEM